MNWPILIAMLLFLGLIMLLMEVLIIPGFGLAGMGAIIFLAAGVYLSWVKLSYVWGIGAALVSISSIVLSFIFIKKSGLTNRFVLGRHVGKSVSPGTQPEKAGNISTGNVSIGQTGLAISDLRPTGIAKFQEHRLNVLTDGIYIKRNTKVKIVRIEGNRIFVEEEHTAQGGQ